MKKIAFVTPWYGRKIPGGAEMEMRGLVAHLHEVGMEVEVLTTCVKEFASNWNVDFHKPGCTVEDGILIRRFLVRKGRHDIFHILNRKLMKGMVLSEKEELSYLYHSVNSDALYDFIRDHQAEYELFVYIPYMFGTTYYGMRECPEKSVLIPCLHDENYAYMKAFKRLFPKIKGMIFNAKPEQELANRLYDLSSVKQAVLGLGVFMDWKGNAECFRRKFGIEEPFILYAGRKDATKNVDTLIRYFARLKEEYGTNLKLVMIGPGEMPIPKEIQEDVHDLGFVDAQDKYDAYAAAHVLCQPSKNESFSIVVMESWLAGRPIMVHQKCLVTSNFAVEADGGFYFDTYREFAMEMMYLLKQPDVADKMGEQGQEYVRKHFSWNVIVKSYREFFEQCSGSAKNENAE